MNQDICISSQARALPGLAKFYLVQLYPLTAILLLCRLAFGFLGLNDRPEAIIWSLIFLPMGLAMIIAIAGLHSRAAWALSLNSALSKGLALLCLTAGIRIMLIIAGPDSWRYGLDQEDIQNFLIPAFFIMNIPAFMAWSRYFAYSEKLGAVFGREPLKNAPKLSGIAVAFMRVLCCSHVAFFATFMAAMLIAGGTQMFKGELPAFIATCALPHIIFPALLLHAASAQNRSLKRVFVVIGLFAICMLLWAQLPYMLAPYFIGNYSMGYVYTLLGNISSIPMPSVVLIFILSVLAAKIWSDPAEQRWFTNKPAKARMPEAFVIYGLALLYYLTSIFSKSAQLFIHNVYSGRHTGWYNITMLLLTLAAIALNVWHLYLCAKKSGNKKNIALLAFSCTALLGLAGLGAAFWVLLLHSTRANFANLINTITFCGVPLAIGTFALLHWRNEYANKSAGASGIFKLSTPCLIFILVCALMMLSGLSQQSLQIIFALLPDDGEFYWLRSRDFGPGRFFLGLEHLVAHLVCPLIAIKWLKNELAERTKFYALGAVWICALIFGISTKTAEILSYNGFGFGVNISRIMEPTEQLYIYAIIFIMLYLGATGKTNGAKKLEYTGEGVAN